MYNNSLKTENLMLVSEHFAYNMDILHKINCKAVMCILMWGVVPVKGNCQCHYWRLIVSSQSAGGKSKTFFILLRVPHQDYFQL